MKAQFADDQTHSYFSCWGLVLVPSEVEPTMAAVYDKSMNKNMTYSLMASRNRTNKNKAVALDFDFGMNMNMNLPPSMDSEKQLELMKAPKYLGTSLVVLILSNTWVFRSGIQMDSLMGYAQTWFQMMMGLSSSTNLGMGPMMVHKSSCSSKMKDL